jgi:hypothetical protein
MQEVMNLCTGILRSGLFRASGWLAFLEMLVELAVQALVVAQVSMAVVLVSLVLG